MIDLNTYEIRVLQTLVNLRADNLRDFIARKDYTAKHSDMAQAVKDADTRYLSELTALETKLYNA
jgi:hypothetical protein